MNWSFSHAGEYLISFQASATRTSDSQLVQSPPTTFRFVVQ
jgi:surface-anchored protein